MEWKKGGDCSTEAAYSKLNNAFDWLGYFRQTLLMKNHLNITDFFLSNLEYGQIFSFWFDQILQSTLTGDDILIYKFY